MGVNQDNGDYEMTISGGIDTVIVLTDVYSSGGTVYCRTTVIGTDFTNSWVELRTPTYSTGRDIDISAWQETVYQGLAARTKSWEISILANETLTLEIYNVAAANIGFAQFEMTPQNTAIFNETFDGGFDNVWYQDDFAGNFGDNPGALTSTTFYPLGYHAGITGSDFANMIAASFTPFNVLTEPDIYVNFGLFYNGYYRPRFWVHSSVGWIECRIGTDNISETPLAPVLLANTLRVNGSNLYSVYVSGFTMTTNIPTTSFDGIIDGIAVLDIYNNVNV